jgi:hypothetical protein
LKITKKHKHRHIVYDDSFNDITAKTTTTERADSYLLSVTFKKSKMIRQLHRYFPKVSLTTKSIPPNETYVPPYQKPLSDDINKLQEFVSHSKRLFIITGAGISTESGIPDYRSEGVGLYARTTNRPM